MNRLKYETHFHTAETSPCGKVPASEGVRIYHDAGYAGIAVTDHYFRDFFDRQPQGSWKHKVDAYLKGYRHALETGIKIGIDIYMGMELRFDENQNDYLVFGFDEDFLYKNSSLYELGLKGFKKLTAGTGIIIVQAHPFRYGMIPAEPDLIDGVEVYNGNPRHDSSNHLAFGYARENGLLMISGSDFHRPEDAARGGIISRERIKPGGFAKMILDNEGLGLVRTEP